MTPAHARFVAFATALLVLLEGHPADAASENFSLAVTRVDVPPSLDGTLNDPAWQKAAHTQLTWDYFFQRPASEQTDVYVMADAKFLYVAFVAKQSEALTATQRTHDIGLGTDDVVRVYFWPSGDKGFEYFFAANPIGTRYCYSSENSAFAPSWQVVAKNTTDGYIVTERIPLGIMRGDGRSTWRLQFDRRVQRSAHLFEWAYANGQGSTDSSFYAGYLTNMNFASTNTRTKPRVAIYVLGQKASAVGGGNTSRMGADFSFPVTPTASFFGTLHPDYSNVELDQQTISPTAFQRQFLEVRPFFTQGTNFYNNFNCNDCTIYPWLYTPSIPTPSHGFAVEGVQGALNLAAFATSGSGRTDAAETANWGSVDHRTSATLLHESVNNSGFTDQLTLAQLRMGNVHNFSLYATGGIDRGSNVTDASLASFGEFGLNFFTPKSGFFPAYRHGGAQFNPVDAFVPLTDVTGPSAYAYREWDFSSTSYIRKIKISYDYQRFHNRFGQLNETNNSSFMSIDTRNLFTIAVSAGASWLLLNGEAGYNNQNGFSLTYGGQTSTPSLLSHYYGSFGTGYLNSSTRSVTFKAGPRATSTIEADDTDFRPAGSATLTQWLEKVNYTYQIGSSSSITAGVRRIIGTGPYFGVAPQFVDAYNVSAAYYRRFGPSELYLVYGDPNSQATKPALILKFILYVGAEKGT
jgi:hypothetical protein